MNLIDEAAILLVADILTIAKTEELEWHQGCTWEEAAAATPYERTILMKTFEFTLRGFDGSTSETDALIKWIGAPDQATAEARARQETWDYVSIEEILLGREPSLSDGCDIIVKGAVL